MKDMKGLLSFEPAVLRTAAGCAAVGLEGNERFLGLIHLGPKRQEQAPPTRPEARDFVTYLP